MSDDPPTPPTDLPDDLGDGLEQCSPTRLRQIAEYAEALAAFRERNDRLDGADDGDGEHADRAHKREDGPENPPDGVPSKATITVKEINDNRYYYWQWRDGEQIRSQYEGPVDPA
ncbi:hypothetical protein ACAH01_16440 (plasmid) [Halomicrobium sp. HM KBTZ05]|uniref:hypothetical protein n=1 Tax=Halomicrobium sp. HM KBTZ05 TaxID=3242663 RepID=UPI003558C87A